MNKLTLTTAALLTATTTTAFAGIDRSGQDISVLFEEGNYFKFSVATTNPSITSDVTGTTQSATPFSNFSFGYKQQFNDNLSFALIWISLMARISNTSMVLLQVVMPLSRATRSLVSCVMKWVTDFPYMVVHSRNQSRARS